MRRIVKAAIALVVTSAVLMFSCGGSPKPFQQNHPVNMEVKSSHMLIFATEDGRGVDLCTATAVGPHALLTADHCNANDELPELTVDYTPRQYHIMDVMHDDHEHQIIFVDGPAFKDIEPYRARAPKVGETVHIEGFGHGVYPATDKQGIVLDEYDPSEVDRDMGLFYSSVPAIPGDSGSAIYAEDGSMVGLLTYGFHKGRHSESGGFTLAFTPEQIDRAKSSDVQVKVVKGKKKPSLFDLLF